MGSSASSHLNFGILGISVDILIQTFLINDYKIAWFLFRATDEGLLPETIV